MNTSKIAKLTLSAVAIAAGAVILSGCATGRENYRESHTAGRVETTLNDTKTYPDTNPQDNYDMLFDYPYQGGWSTHHID